MYKNIGINSAFTLGIAAATVARVKVTEDNQVMIRFTDRTNTSNLPKGQVLAKVGVKGSGRRIGFQSAIADKLPQPGTPITLVAGKYGWYKVAEAADGQTINGRISA